MKEEPSTMTTATKPAPPEWLPEPNENAPFGWEWQPSKSENLDWTIGGPLIEQGRRCRFSEAGARCPNAAEVILWRRERQPWAYCTQHMYGRWIENGMVMHWNLVKKRGAPKASGSVGAS